MTLTLIEYENNERLVKHTIDYAQFSPGKIPEAVVKDNEVFLFEDYNPQQGATYAWTSSIVL